MGKNAILALKGVDKDRAEQAMHFCQGEFPSQEFTIVKMRSGSWNLYFSFGWKTRMDQREDMKRKIIEYAQGWADEKSPFKAVQM